LDARTPIWKWLGVALVAAVGCAPIAVQSVQVDDPLFLGVAKQILQTPLSPFEGKPPWHDRDWFAENANPPLWPYLLVATAKLLGWNEIAFHGLQCVANFALAFGVFMLARRVCTRPLFWTTAVLWSPFLLPGRNLMADTLLLALWCWSFEFFLQDALDGKPGRAFWAGLFASAALLTKYTGGLLAPLFLLLGWKWNTPRRSAWLLPMIAFALWCVHNQLVYGRLHFFANVGAGGMGFVDRLRVFTRIVGAMVVWAPVWMIAAWAAGRGWQRFLLALALPAAALFAGLDLYDVIVRFQLANVIANDSLITQFALFSASGILLFATFLVLPLRTRDGSQSDKTRFALLVWLLVAAAFNLLATSAVAFGAVRHLLIVFTPLLLIGGDAFDRASLGKPLLRFVAWLTLALGAALGCLLAHGDWLAAKAGVEAADEIKAAVAESRDVWTFGDPALRYYAEPLGAHWWRGDADEIPVGGGVVVLYSRGLAFRHHPMFNERLMLVRRARLESWNPFRTQTGYASFYAANVLTLPWMVEIGAGARGPRGGWLFDDVYVYRRMK